MGYIRHHAVVVTGTYEDWVERAHRVATDLIEDHRPGGHGHKSLLTPITGESVNGTRSFMLAPDGSKEGWEMSATADYVRDRFVEWLHGVAYEDGSSPLAWAVVQYGDDNGVTKIVDHSDSLTPGD